MLNINIFTIRRVIYSTFNCSGAHAMDWTNRDTCIGLYHPSAFFVKGGSCSNSLTFPLREQSHHRGKEAENASRSTAVECFVSGIHDPNPSVQECCPTLGQKASTDRAKITSFLMNSQTLLIQKDWGGKGSKTETWKEVPSPPLKGQNLKATDFFFLNCLLNA